MYLIEATNTDVRTDLHIYSRVNGKKVIDIVHNVEPYFYVPEDELIPEDNRIVSVKSGYKHILGFPVKKITVQKAKDVRDIRDSFSKCFEADIPLPQRYIIDIIGEVEIYPLKTLYFDIELNTHHKFADIKNPDQEVTCITMTDNFEGRNIMLVLDNGRNNITKKDNLEIFKTEEELLYAFLRHFNEYDPDIISGWNVEQFDLVYLIGRMDKLGIDYRLLSPHRSVYYDERFKKLSIKGIVIIDMMRGYEHYRKISNQGKAESKSLEYTSQEVLGKGKIKFKETWQEMWFNNPDKLIEYCMVDTILVKEINDKEKIIEFFNSIRAKACAQLKDIYNTSVLVDGLVLRKARNRVVLPSKSSTKGKPYSGAEVVSPIPGLYKFILGLDVKSEYPNLMRTFNISYETFDLEGGIKLYDGVAYVHGMGLIPEIVTDLEKERNLNKKLKKEAKSDSEKLMYHFRQYAVKVLMNSLYGYLGFEGSRFYKEEIANSITTMGRNLILFAKANFEKLGYKVIYGDTDSLYIQSKETEERLVKIEGLLLKDFINEKFKEFAASYGADRCSLEMDFEKVFAKILFVAKKGNDEEGAKKKYAYKLLWKDGEIPGKIEFTGFETVRSDYPRIGRDAQKMVLEMVLNDVGKDEIVEYVKSLDKKMRRKEISEEDYSFPRGITEELSSYGKSKEEEDGKKKTGSGIPPVVAGAKYSNKYLGTNFEKGNKPKWIYVRAVPPGFPNTNVITFDEYIPEGFIPDYDLMSEKIFINKLSAIFEAAGFGEFPNINTEKQDLSQYFKVKK